jgi:hypothetical protein
MGAIPAVPGGATAIIVLGDKTVKVVAGIPANVTAVVPLKFEPVIVTGVPPATGPDAGESLVTMGVGAAAS